MLSEWWIGDAYEIFRLLRSRRLGDESDAFEAIFQQLELIRIGVEKHEIPKDWKLVKPLQMARVPPQEDDAQPSYVYDKDDPRRAHIMPVGLSQRGSMMWQAIDHLNDRALWIERRYISEAILGLWTPLLDTAPPGLAG